MRAAVGSLSTRMSPRQSVTTSLRGTHLHNGPIPLHGMLSTDHTSIHIWDRQTINESEALTMRRQSPLGLFSSQISHSLFSNKHEIVFDQSGAQFDAELLRLVLVFDSLNIDDQRVFHTEYRICGFIGIVLEVQSTESFSQLSCFAT